MADNFIYIPKINPLRFYDPDRAVTAKYRTKHFDDFTFPERLLDWQEPSDFKKIWQTSDIIKLQFESTFDPIIVDLLDENDEPVITLPALIGLPNKFIPGTYSFEIAMSLASVTTGCYRVQLTCGSGLGQRLFITPWMYISEEPIENSFMLEYWHTREHEDVVFQTGITFQYRVLGHFGFLTPGRVDEQYKDQKLNPAILSSRTFSQFDVFFGDEFGLPDDEIDLLNRIWSCNNVLIDNQAFGITEGGKFELTEVEEDRYPKRGVKLVVEEGINRHSKIFSVETDTTKKLQYAIAVEAKVWGDTSNQGSANTVPIITVE